MYLQSLTVNGYRNLFRVHFLLWDGFSKVTRIRNRV